MPAWLLPAIEAAGSIIGSGLNAIGIKSANDKQRDFSLMMYNRQRADALSDWNMQNEYNSPAAQMQRFKDAGLNPNLIYGQQTTSPSVRSSSAPSYNPSPVPYGDMAKNAVGTYFDVSMRQQMLSNAQQQENIMKLQQSKLAADIVYSGIRNGMGQLNLKKANELYDTAINTANITLDNLTIKRNMMMHQEHILEDTQELTIQAANQKLLNMIQDNAKSVQQTEYLKAAINNMIKDGKLKDFEIQLNKAGVTKGDATWLRMMIQFLSKFGITLE